MGVSIANLCDLKTRLKLANARVLYLMSYDTEFRNADKCSHVSIQPACEPILVSTLRASSS